jgi:hypothetical protein
VLYSARTATDGRAHFQNLKPAHYDLTAIKEGLETVPRATWISQATRQSRWT